MAGNGIKQTNEYLQQCFDEPSQSLNVKTNLAVSVSGNQEILIDSVHDSIQLGDAGGNLVGVTAGALNVNASSTTAGPVSPGTAASKSDLVGAVYNSSAPSPTTGQQLALQADGSGNLKVNVVTGGGTSTSSTSTVTSVASSATNVTLLASNSSRKAAYFFNDSTTVLYLKFGVTASASSYTVQVAAGYFYEMPTAPVFLGEIDGIWASANGNCRITELT